MVWQVVRTNQLSSLLTSQLSKIGEDRFQVVVLNSRGCARSKVTNRQLVTAFFTADIEEFLVREKARHPNRPIYGVGFSFGSTLLVNYLGRVGDKTPLSAAVVVCNPWDMVLSSEKMEKDYWSRTFFSKAITQFLTRMVKVNMAELETPEGTKPDRKPTVDNPNYFAFTRSNFRESQDIHTCRAIRRYVHRSLPWLCIRIRLLQSGLIPQQVIQSLHSFTLDKFER